MKSIIGCLKEQKFDKSGGYSRNSSIELFRIISMLVIVAHHYVVNSGCLDMIYESNTIGLNDIFLLIFGWGGKTGINCFVLITGYFMCTSNITVKKFMKLMGERYFYVIVFFFIFLVTGYAPFSFKTLLKIVIPVFKFADNFTMCFIAFYLFIPFMNKLVKAMSEGEHIILMGLLLTIYTIFPSFVKATVTFNYITWFCVLYIIASFFRLYPKRWMNSAKIWGGMTALLLLLSWLSVVLMLFLGDKIGKREWAFFFVSDSNKVLALATGVSAFLFFKNLKMAQSKIINTIASSCFGVLLIHANSDTMRQWLWQDTLNNTAFYNSPYLVLHAVGSVLLVYMICTFIDQMRMWAIERLTIGKSGNSRR